MIIYLQLIVRLTGCSKSQQYGNVAGNLEFKSMKLWLEFGINWNLKEIVRELIGDEMESSGLYVWKDELMRCILRIMMDMFRWTHRKLWRICVYGHLMELMMDCSSFWSSVCSFVFVVMCSVISMRWFVFVHAMLFASGKDRVFQYVIVIMDYCPSWTLLSDTRSDHEVIRYMYSLCTHYSAL